MATTMSMKRSKPRGAVGERDQGSGIDYWAKPVGPEKSWDEEVSGRPEDAFAPYSMSTRYSKGQLVSHTKFGKGVVTEADASKVEILFQEGKKKLGHGQQA